MFGLSDKVKILNDSLIHHGFKYVEGLNIDTKPFVSSGVNQPGGLYFTDLLNMPNFLKFGSLEVFVQKNFWSQFQLILNLLKLEVLPI